MSNSLSDLVIELRSHLMELRSPKTKQTSGILWDIERHERWLKALDPIPGEAARQILVKATESDPFDQLCMARDLLEAVAPTLGPVREALLRSVGIESVRGTLQLLEAEARLDAKLDKANAGGDR